MRRILDLGTGNGRLLALLRQAIPEAEGVGLDISPTLMQAAREHFADDRRVHLASHDFNNELPELGCFDVVVSSLAIHHVPEKRKRSLYREIFECLEPGGVFFNLEHVTRGSLALHSQYLAAIGLSPGEEDPSNQLAPVGTQLRWLREIGFLNVDCYWKWLELALLGGIKDRATTDLDAHR